MKKIIIIFITILVVATSVKAQNPLPQLRIYNTTLCDVDVDLGYTFSSDPCNIFPLTYPGIITVAAGTYYDYNGPGGITEMEVTVYAPSITPTHSAGPIYVRNQFISPARCAISPPCFCNKPESATSNGGPACSCNTNAFSVVTTQPGGTDPWTVLIY